MNASPLISVILPIYNKQVYLPRCMESLLSQTYRNLELVLVDDGSCEECAQLCDRYVAADSRVRACHKKNGGISDARNCGLLQATGEYISYVDPDDDVDADYIEYLFDLIRKYETPMSVCQHRVIFESGRIKDYGTDGDERLSGKTCVERMLYHDVIDTSVWGKLYRRDLFDGITFPLGKQFEDMGTVYKLMLKSGQIAVGYASKYSYYMRRDSITNCTFNPHKLDLLEMTDRMAEEVVSLFPDLKDAALRRRVYARFSTLNQLLHTNEEQLKAEQVRFIREHRMQVLKQKRAPKRDKAAILALSLGLKNYATLWSFYEKHFAGEDWSA